ncbi:MAG: hypothetical protein SGCHY_000947 [Lobulomycetales sp.]
MAPAAPGDFSPVRAPRRHFAAARLDSLRQFAPYRRDTIDVMEMTDYCGIVCPESHIPLSLLHSLLAESLELEYNEYRNMPHSGNAVCLPVGETMLACPGGGECMDQLQIYRLLDEALESVAQVDLGHRIHQTAGNMHLVAARTSGSVSLISASNGKLIETLDFPNTPVHAAFNPFIADECAILRSGGQLHIWDGKDSRSALMITAACRNAPSEFHVALGCLEKAGQPYLVTIDSRYAKRPLQEWKNVAGSDPIAGIQSTLATSSHNGGSSGELISWTRHEADVLVFPVDGDFDSFEKNLDYTCHRPFPLVGKYASIYSPSSLQPIGVDESPPPLMGLAVRSHPKHANLTQTFQMTYDGAVYLHSYARLADSSEEVHSTPYTPCEASHIPGDRKETSSLLIDANIEAPDTNFETLTTDGALEGNDDNDEEAVARILSYRDEYKPGMIRFAGLSKEPVYPPPPLSAEMSMREHRVYNLQNVWKYITSFLDPEIVRESPALPPDYMETIVDRWDQQEGSFFPRTLYELQKLVQTAEIRYDSNGKYVIPCLTPDPSPLQGSPSHDRLVRLMSTRHPAESFCVSRINETSAEEFYSEKEVDAGTQGNESGDGSIALEWIRNESYLATHVCQRLAPLESRSKPREAPSSGGEGLLNPPSDDEDEGEYQCRQLRTMFSSKAITLSVAASQLFDRWDSPQDFYGAESLAEKVPMSEGDGARKRVSAHRRRTQEYQKKMKEASDRNLEAFLSQTSAGGSQSMQVASAPTIFSSSSQPRSSGGIGVMSQPGSASSSKIKKKPKRRRVRGF